MSFSLRNIPILFLFLLLGCSGSQEAQDDELTEEEIEAHKEREEKIQETDVKKKIDQKALDSLSKSQEGSKRKGSKEAFIYHERTPCFGKCPIYTLRVQKNGKAELKVERNMEVEKGNYKGKVKQDKLERIQKKARSIGFFEMKKSYNDPNVTDVPTRITELRFGDNRHRVRNRHGGPEKLGELESLIHGIAKNTDWDPTPSDE